MSLKFSQLFLPAKHMFTPPLSSPSSPFPPPRRSPSPPPKLLLSFLVFIVIVSVVPLLLGRRLAGLARINLRVPIGVRRYRVPIRALAGVEIASFGFAAPLPVDDILLSKVVLGRAAPRLTVFSIAHDLLRGLICSAAAALFQVVGVSLSRSFVGYIESLRSAFRDAFFRVEIGR